jgi:serine/threonine protein kinase
MEILVNQVLGDRYQVKSLLGRQTGRRTFLAADLQTAQSVVLKLLLFGPDFTWDDLKLFEREAEVLKSLDLPTIPKYLDCFDVETALGKGFVLVQTYIEARSLQNWLDAGRTFSEEELILIAKQLLTILDYLHDRQPAVIHRDIKPSNILLGDRSGNSPGQVYLVDFGSVKTAANGSTITVVGTYGYMPPEQFGGQTSPASDLYALGATIICLATGQHPSELPHRDMRIDFIDRVNLSLLMIEWLQSMTATSVDSRLKSASQALLALSTPNQNSENTLKFAGKPFGSKIQVRNTSQRLDITVPPHGFHLALIPVIGGAVFWNFCLLPFILVAVTTFSSGGWFLLLFMSAHLWIGIGMIWNIVFDLFGTRRLRINESRISLSIAIFGLRCFPYLTAARQHIDRVDLAPLSYTKDSDGDRVAVPPHLNIWAGNKQFCLNNFNLTQPEQVWLASELTEWLDLPDRVEPQTQKIELRKQKRERRKFPPLSTLNTSSNKLEP